jgi:hypothetical protein
VLDIAPIDRDRVIINTLSETELGFLFPVCYRHRLSVAAVTVLETEQGAHKECLWGWEDLYKPAGTLALEGKLPLKIEVAPTGAFPMGKSTGDPAADSPKIDI